MRASILIACTALVSLFASPLASAADEPSKALRGVARHIDIRGVSCELRSKPTDPRTAPVVLSVETVGDVQRLAVVGLRSGVVDLAEFIECSDGTRPSGLPDLRLDFVTTIPADAGLDLSTRALPTMLSGRRPDWLWKVLLGVWLAAPLLWTLRKWLRWRASRPKPPEPQPIRLDSLTELVVTMGARPLTVPERGALELLTLRALLELRSASTSTTGNLYTEARLDPQAASLLDALERWLHHPSVPDQPPARLRKALSELADRLAAARQTRTGGAA
ncbi:MAG: hypothetical protein K2Y21_03295 [Phycisphaerales bacterium]|nr:hypothetical protein [Phycisphaerales bacterium]